MASTVWGFEVEYLAKIAEWVKAAPEGDLLYIDRLEISDVDGKLVGHYYLGDDERFERAVSK